MGVRVGVAGQTDMARSTRLVILIKNIYTLWGGNASFCLLHTFRRLVYPFTSTSNGYNKELVYPFTLRVTGIITRKNAIVYLDYQIPVTQLNRDIQLSDTRYSAKLRYASSKARLKCATNPWSQYAVMWYESSKARLKCATYRGRQI